MRILFQWHLGSLYYIIGPLLSKNKIIDDMVKETTPISLRSIQNQTTSFVALEVTKTNYSEHIPKGRPARVHIRL